MLRLSQYYSQLMYGLFISVLMLLIVPWVYYQKDLVKYSFLPRRIIFVFIALFGAVLILASAKNLFKKIGLFFAFMTLAGIHWYVNKDFEPHYLLQFIYLELAVLLFYAPNQVKDFFLKYSSWLLYLFLAKALYFRIGAYIHGGLLSSNLYATYIIFMCLIEVSRKRYWNLIPAGIVLFYVGSKACYISFILILFYLIYKFALIKISYLKKIEFNNSFIINKLNFLSILGLSFVSIVGFSTVATHTSYFADFKKKMEVNKEATTQNNLILYGISEKNVETEQERKVLQKTKDMQFNDNKLSLTAPPMVTNIDMSLGLRITQYDYMIKNLNKFFIIGNTKGSQAEMYGHNPHTAALDFISRLGILSLLLMLFFYKELFINMNSIIFNLALFPIFCFQPYGFTIGHSLVLLSLFYGLFLRAESVNSGVYSKS